MYVHQVSVLCPTSRFQKQNNFFWLPGLVTRNALFWAITQHVVVIPYRRFGTT